MPEQTKTTTEIHADIAREEDNGCALGPSVSELSDKQKTMSITREEMLEVLDEEIKNRPLRSLWTGLFIRKNAIYRAIRKVIENA